MYKTNKPIVIRVIRKVSFYMEKGETFRDMNDILDKAEESLEGSKSDFLYTDDMNIFGSDDPCEIFDVELIEEKKEGENMRDE